MAHLRLVISVSPPVTDSAAETDAHQTHFPAAIMGMREAQLALRILDRTERLRIAEIAKREKRASDACTIVSFSQRPGSAARLGDIAASLRHGPVSRDIRRRGLLLDDWYRREHVTYHVCLSALSHLLGVGIAQDLAPNPFFDPVWYRRAHRLAADDAPLVHYLRYGAAQALAPSALFDPVAYLQAYPDLAMEPDLLGHYISRGIAEGRTASVLQWSVD